MTKSQIFSAAHAAARKATSVDVSYRAAFAAALRTAYAASKAPRTLVALIADLPEVARLNAWKDRQYVNLAAYNPRANGDRNTKIWVRGDVLTIEIGRGYSSTEFNAAKDVLIAAARQSGAVVREL